MRILVTGVSGQVGSAVLKRLHGHDVLAADRSVLDLSDPGSLAAALDRLRPEVLINCAAYTAVDKAEQETELAHVVNAQSPGILATWAEANGAVLVHFSTDYVFDGSGDRPWREDDRTAPLSAYGKTKLEGERAVLSRDGDALIVRTSWVYAAAGKNFLRTIARLAAERDELRIVADQFGAPTSAAVIADGVSKIVGDNLDLLRSRCRKAGRLVHLAAAGETTWFGFTCAIVEGLRERGVPLRVKEVKPIKSEEYPTPAARPRNSRLCLTRLQDVFGVEPLQWDRALQAELDLLASELH